MPQVFAGFVVGYALALLLAPLGAIAIIRSNDRSGVAQRIAPPGTNVVALSVVLHFAAFLVLTAVGIILGMALAGLDERRDASGLGSPNIAYTLLVCALTAVVVIPFFVSPAARRPAVVVAVLFALAFGWGVPWLAQLGS